MEQKVITHYIKKIALRYNRRKRAFLIESLRNGSFKNVMKENFAEDIGEIAVELDTIILFNEERDVPILFNYLERYFLKPEEMPMV